MAEIQIGFLVTGAKTGHDLADALRAIAVTLDRDGAGAVGKDYTVGKMGVKIRQR